VGIASTIKKEMMRAFLMTVNLPVALVTACQNHAITAVNPSTFSPVRTFSVTSEARWRDNAAVLINGAVSAPLRQIHGSAKV